MPELDRYDSEMVDDSEQSELSIDARRRAEEEMRKRDRRAGRIPAALDGIVATPAGLKNNHTRAMRWLLMTPRVSGICCGCTCRRRFLFRQILQVCFAQGHCASFVAVSHLLFPTFSALLLAHAESESEDEAGPRRRRRLDREAEDFDWEADEVWIQFVIVLVQALPHIPVFEMVVEGVQR